MIAPRPAELSDLASLRPMMPARHLARLTDQLLHSQAVTVTADGRPLAMLGLYPMPGHFEAWFVAAPDLRGSRAVPAVLRIFDRLRRALPQDMQIVTTVAEGHETGFRLARILGFAPVLQSLDRRQVVLALNRPQAAVGCPMSQGQQEPTTWATL
jgi:hypothetical protein